MHLDILKEQDGVITRRQAFESGLSRRAIDRFLRDGSWERRGYGVYLAVDHPFTDTARIRCAVWGAGDDAAASGRAAAFWHNVIDKIPQIIDVTVPRSGRNKAADCKIRRRNVHSKDIVERRGLRVTSLALSVLEASIDDPGLMDTALQRHVGLDELRRAHARNAGRSGAVKAERMLRAAEGGARSEAERLLVKLLKAAKIQGWKVNYRYGRFEIDVAFPAERLAIEIDGWAFHSGGDAFQYDRARQNVLSADWQVLRYTWMDLTERPTQVIEQIVAMLNEIRGSGPR